MFTFMIQLSAVCLRFHNDTFWAIFNHCQIAVNIRAVCQNWNSIILAIFGSFWKRVLHDLDASVFAFLDLRLCLRVDFTLKLAFDMKRSLVARLTYKPFSLWIWMKVVLNLPFLVYHTQCLKLSKKMVSFYNNGSINVNK